MCFSVNSTLASNTKHQAAVSRISSTPSREVIKSHDVDSGTHSSPGRAFNTTFSTRNLQNHKMVEWDSLLTVGISSIWMVMMNLRLCADFELKVDSASSQQQSRLAYVTALTEMPEISMQNFLSLCHAKIPRWLLIEKNETILNDLIMGGRSRNVCASPSPPRPVERAHTEL